MISEFKTAQFLTAKLQAFAALHSYRLAVQGAKFEPAVDEIYLKETLLANRNEQLGVGFDSCGKQLPIYQIDVYTPKDKGGKYPALSIGDLLTAEFKRGPIIFDDGSQTIQITNSSAEIMPANTTHNWCMVTVELTIHAT